MLPFACMMAREVYNDHPTDVHKILNVEFKNFEISSVVLDGLILGGSNDKKTGG